MAKLGSYYGLCPLIDHKSLLGVSEDVNPGCVIVTLGRNMAIKYKLSDQKQLYSWSTKEKLSSPVVYDKKENRYVAIFNQTFLRVWEENEKNLEKVKKIKFTNSLHTILSTDDDPVVVFKDGRVMGLTLALQNRKNIEPSDIVDKSTTIESQTCLKVNDEYYVGLLLKKDNDYTFLWVRPDFTENDDNIKHIRKIELKRSGVRLNGHLAMITDSGPKLFTLWSDGRLYTQSLDAETPEVFFSVIESLSRQQPVCLVALNSTYVAMYGADTNQEGALLQIYNTQFKVTQSKLQLKLFALGSKLWLIGSSILLTIGQNLAVVPFHLATEQLAALVGSHRLISMPDDEDIAIVSEMIIENWGAAENPSTNHELFIDLPIKSQVTDLIKEGWSETAITEEIFPKLIEKKDITTILLAVDYFTDIPESIIVKIVSFCLHRLIETKKNFDHSTKKISGQSGLLLDKILIMPFNDVLLLPHLRTVLKFDEMLILLQYICYLLSENGHNLPNTETDTIIAERKLIEWGCLLLDGHYQQLLLSKDAQIIESLQYFKLLVDTYMLCMDDYKKIQPVVAQFNKGKKTTKLLNNSSVKYSIEKIKLY